MLGCGLGLAAGQTVKSVPHVVGFVVRLLEGVNGGKAFASTGQADCAWKVAGLAGVLCAPSARLHLRRAGIEEKHPVALDGARAFPDGFEAVAKLAPDLRVVDHVFDRKIHRIEPGGDALVAGLPLKVAGTFQERAARAQEPGLIVPLRLLPCKLQIYMQ